jgi:hypothetical protein
MLLLRKLTTRSRQRVKAYKARLACARVAKNAARYTPNAADSTKWRAGKDETKNRGDCDAYRFAIDTDATRPKMV